MPRLIRMIALTGALLLVLAACGGDTTAGTTPALPSLTEQATDTEPDATTTTKGAVDPEEAFQEYAACMREHGIDMPDPASSEGGMIVGEIEDALDFEAIEEAGAECDPILEGAFGEFELTPEQEAERMDQELTFAQCMRDNGVDWPDPTRGGAPVIDLGDGMDPETLGIAMEACAPDTLNANGGVFIGGGTP